MPRLPDANSLGARPGSGSNRPIATFDTTAVGEAMALEGRGQQALGQGIQSLGQGVGRYADHLEREAAKERIKDLEVEGARADSHFNTGRIGLETSFKDDDADYLSWGKRYEEGSKKLLDEAAAMIPDERTRELWRLRRMDDVAAGAARVQGLTERRNKIAGIADTNAQLDALTDSALASGDPKAAGEAVRNGQALIERARRAGWLDDNQAQDLSRKWAVDYATKKIRLEAPEDRIHTLSGNVQDDERAKQAAAFFQSKGWQPHQAAGIVGNLVAESRLNTGARNAGDGRDGSDSIGIAQWNSDRAVRLKRFAEARGKSWNDFETQLEFVDLELRTSEGKAGALLTNAKDAREAAEAFIMYERPAGSQKGASYAHGYKARVGYAEALAGAGGKESELLKILPPDIRARELETAQRQYRTDQIQAREAATFEYNQRFNSLDTAIIDGKAGLAEIDAARQEGWLADADHIVKLQSRVESVNKGALALRGAQEALVDPGKVWDPTDAADKKAIDLLFDAGQGAQRMTQGDEAFVTGAVVPLIQRTGMVPRNAKGALLGMMRASDPQQVVSGLKVMDQVERANPEAFLRDMGPDATRKLMTWRENANYRKPEEIVEMLRRQEDPAQAKVREDLMKKGEKLAKDVPESAILDAFDPGWFSSGPDASSHPATNAVMRADFNRLYAEEYAHTSGDADLATDRALKLLKNAWGSSAVTGDSRMMKHPPERYYPRVGGAYDWMAKQAKEEILSTRAPSGGAVKAFSLVPDARTEADIKAGQRPSYSVVVQDENGVWDVLRKANGQMRRHVFDPKSYQTTAREGFAAERTQQKAFREGMTDQMREDAAPLEVLNGQRGDLTLPDVAEAR